MEDEDKAKDQLLGELAGLRQRVAELEAADAEREQAEEVLQENERRYRLLTEHLTDVICTLDMDLRFTYISPSVTDMLGYSVEEMMAEPVKKVLTPASFEVARKTLEEAQTAAEPEDRLELELNRKDGSTVWTEVKTAFLRDEDGQPVGILGIARDITERREAEQALRKAHDESETRIQERTAELANVNEELRIEIAERVRAEEALREGEEYYNSIIESIPSSLLTIDHNLRVVSANRNFLQKARRSESDTIGRRINEVFSLAVLVSSRLEERITEVFETGRSSRGGEMERLPGLFGRVYFYRISPLKDEKGEVKSVVLFMDDVTEQKRLSEEVRRVERHLASVVDSAHDLVASVDAEGKLLTWNKAAEQASGFRFREVRDRYLPDLCVEEDRQKMGSWLAQLARGRFTEKSMEANLGTKGGEAVPISWAGSRMLDDERKIVGLVAVGRDLTERKQLEAQLIQSAKLTSLGVMAGGIAHEIRNPLAISSAATQLLLEQPDDEKFREEAAERIYSGIQRASYIIENLLKFARPPEERMEPMDINETLEETLSLLANQLKVQRVELRKDFAPDALPVVGNKSLLQQVFSNMILNACNAMPDGGKLTVATRATEAGVEIQFADTGVGVPPEHLSKIFDPFFTTMPVGKGIGLGLSISYSIIQRHQGTIEVASAVDQGTVFTIRLPVTPGDE